MVRRAPLNGAFNVRFAMIEESTLPESVRTAEGSGQRGTRHASSLRMVALMSALALIVGLAFLIRMRVTASTIDAMQWVAHTHEVKAAAFELRSTLSEMEAAAFAAQLDPLSERAARRYGDARARYPAVMERLRHLSRDNPEQQERSGALRAQIEGRVASFDEALLNRAQGRDSQASEGLLTAVTRFPVDDVLNAMISTEEGLVAEREQRAQQQTRIGGWIVAAVSAIQLLLLAAIIWASETQLRRRLSAEATARQAVERAQLIVATVREPIAVIGADLKLVTCNRAFTDYYGLKRDETLSGSPAWSDKSLLQRLRDVSLTQREIWDYELAQSIDGELSRNVLVNARPMSLPDSGDGVVLLTISDITARKRFEGEILELNRQLTGKVEQVSETNRELEAFSYSVSHDLRAPLRHIAGFAEKLRAHLGENADERTRHYSDIVVNSARRMSSLIEDLLTYSRLGRHAMRLRSVDMQALVEEVRISLTSMLENDRITWRIAPLPVVVADENMVRLVWQNLLDNAIKYSAPREQAVIEIGNEATPIEWTFWIKDNGVGFDMTYVEKLFGVFQRLHKASEFAGTGIGLASVRRIVSRHGGRTWAQSSPGEGATFFFSLPRSQNQH
jgi:PAS domain S-box-containing protein